MACPSTHLPRCPQWPKAPHHFINVFHQARVWVGGGLRLVAGGGSCGLPFFPTKQQYLLSPTYPYVLFKNKGALRPLKMHELMLTLQMLKLEGRRNICTYSIPKCDFLSQMNKENTLPSSSEGLIWALPLVAGCDLG